MSRLSLLLLLAAAIGAWGCGERTGEPASSQDPAGLALQVFDLARHGEPDERELQRLFGVGAGDAQATALLETLARLASVGEPRVASVEPLEGLDRVAVDLVAPGSGGGEATYTVQLVQLDGHWRVHWVAGPESAWPSRRAGRGSGLSTSATGHSEPAGDPR